MKITGKQVQAISVEVDPSDFLKQLHREWVHKVVKDEDAVILDGHWHVNYRGRLEKEREAKREDVEVNDSFLRLMDEYKK